MSKITSLNAADLICELIDELHLTKRQKKMIVWRCKWEWFWYKVNKRLRVWRRHKKGNG